MTSIPAYSSRLAGLQWPALIVGLLALAAAMAGGATDRAGFFGAYLFAYLFWLGIALGSLAMTMLHPLVGGEWGRVIRRAGTAAALTLPLMILLFVPLVFGMHDLYIWSRPDAVAHSPLLQHRQPWLNTPFFLIRAAVYLLTWAILAILLARFLPRSLTARGLLRLRRLCAAGLVIYAVTMSLASIDWIMTRDVEWHSTIFGFIVLSGQALSGLTFLTLFLLLTAPRPLPGPSVLNDLGNLLLTLVILWAYIAFAQFLVTWMGNTREEVGWYTQRGLGNPGVGWKTVGLALIVIHFFIPFFLLLFRYNKRQPILLGIIAAVLLAMRILDQYWLVAPAGPGRAPHATLTWFDFVTPIGIGGLWLAVFLWRFRVASPDLPVPLPEAPHGS